MMFTFSMDNFGKARKIGSMGDGAQKASYREVCELAAEHGYIIHPDCCTEEVMEWLNFKAINYNSTFYQTWEDVVSRNRIELLIDQLIHYATTYGTQMQGEPYVPNEHFNNDGDFSIPYKELKLITPISDEELFEKCREALYTGVALNSTTLTNYVDFIAAYINEYDAEIDVEAIKNRDAYCIMCSKLGKFPSDPVMALKTLVYTATRSCTFVQNDDLFRNIKIGHPVNLKQLTDDQIKGFATIFNRFKRVFLSFKKQGGDNAAVINRISKLSKTLHQPMVKGFWESILEEEKSVEEIAAHLKSLNNFKKVRLLQLVKERLNPSKDHVYIIRNGKSFVRLDYTPNAVSESYCNTLYSMIRESLVDSLKPKACPIRLPKNCELTLPSSEKTFVGNIPFGTSIKMADHNIVGIYWRNEWGTHDFDLSFMALNGCKIGWNADYYNEHNVIFSGDMTNANPEATELMYMSESAPDAVVQINRFNGSNGSKFRLFFAQEDLSDKEELRNYMVDPNSILWDVMVESDDAQQNVGLISNNTFYMMNLQTGNARVSGNNAYNHAFIETMKARTKCFVKLADILADAGFTVIDENTADGANATADNVMDFRDLKKDTIINLMA